MNKKSLSIVLEPELYSVLQQLKEIRKTRNSTQIVREALWEYSEKILSQNVHKLPQGE